MERSLRRFWFEFDSDDMFLRSGVGVTGTDEQDCYGLIAARLLDGDDLPPVRKVTCDVDVATLEESHVLPNIGDVISRGVWFPRV